VLGLIALALLPSTGLVQRNGDTLTHDLTLATDLHCSTGWTALSIGRSGITLDLNGKTLSGTRALSSIHLGDVHSVSRLGRGAAPACRWVSVHTTARALSLLRSARSVFRSWTARDKRQRGNTADAAFPLHRAAATPHPVSGPARGGSGSTHRGDNAAAHSERSIAR
jgi:hypothetical protein